MSAFLDGFIRWSDAAPQRVAFANSSGQRIDYGTLHRQSDALCAHLLEADETAPIAIYGHKHPLMLAAMLACIKANLPFVPLDTAWPPSRVDAVLEQIGETTVCDLSEGDHDFEHARRVLSLADVERICRKRHPLVGAYPAASPDDLLYILFTSGSTGAPKGVMQSRGLMDMLDAQMQRYLVHDAAGEPLDAQVVFDRAPYSFILGLLSFFGTLSHGHAGFSLDGPAEASLKLAFETLAASGATTWLSTPSFLNMCLVDPSFCEAMLPQLRSVAVIGERLSIATARSVLERFENARLYNTYGSTEANVATDLLVTPQLLVTLGDEPYLPLGHPCLSIEASVIDPDDAGFEPVEGIGEICLTGPQIGPGYYRDERRTAHAFIEHGDATRSFRTGDRGWVDADGMVHFIERLDFQVKVNGNRVELGEVEARVLAQPEVAACCVTPVERRGALLGLDAHIVPMPGVEGSRELARELKKRLKRELPEYMVPRAIRCHDALPMTASGKVDRQRLAQNRA